jgi:photosystem II stability/assembly factor-like uncharacterized protein
MVATRNVQVRDGDVMVLVGTMKGSFILRSNAARKQWDLGGPYFPGHAVYAMAYDDRGGRPRLWAGTNSMHWGAVLRSSDDFGRTWTEPETANVKFPVETGASLKQIWKIEPGRRDEPGVLYCGVEPAALFESRDGGATWTLNEGLYEHPHRSQWQPGGGGLCLHTILPDPTNRNRMVIAISTGGVYRTDDGGRTWQSRNHGVRAQFLPDKHPEFGQCVHKIVMHPSRPERIFLQNHWGLYRSDDGGDSWQDIANGVPSDFGFCMTMHPHDPETVYIVPIESDEFRCVPEGKLRVYRTRNAGRSWEPLTRGLPQKNALELVLRDAMSADRCNPAGVYIGTRSGRLYGSPDGGTSWVSLADGLPPVVSVEAVVVGEPKAPRRSNGAKTAARRARPKGRSAKPAKAKRGARRAKAKPARRRPVRAKARKKK